MVAVNMTTSWCVASGFWLDMEVTSDFTRGDYITSCVPVGCVDLAIGILPVERLSTHCSSTGGIFIWMRPPLNR